MGMELAKPLKYALHVIVRPFDGFWDLKHEKRGSLSAAMIILAAWLVIQAFSYRYMGFTVYIINWEYFNVWRALLTSLIPLLLWCVSNWCFTTLMDGKGSMKDIFIATCYTLTPYVLINPFLIIISNVITVEEHAFWIFFSIFSTIWFVFLMLAAMMETHEYSFSKAMLSSLLTIIGIGVMLFLFFIFFSLISDSVAYFVALYKEIVFRFY